MNYESSAALCEQTIKPSTTRYLSAAEGIICGHWKEITEHVISREWVKRKPSCHETVPCSEVVVYTVRRQTKIGTQMFNIIIIMTVTEEKAKHRKT